MCQLTFTNLGSREKNIAVTLMSALINSEHNAPHGFGLFYDEQGVYKTEQRACTLVDLGDVVASMVTTDKPIMSHVRLASKGVELKRENNHPFETKSFVGAHNGTLYLTEEQASYSSNSNESRGSDSLRFFQMLQEEYDKNGNKFVPAIQDTMKKHKGKFAFLIYEKPTGTFYVVRGKTADLYYAEFTLEKGKKSTYIGFVVNTEKWDLEKLCSVVTNVWGLMGETGVFKYSVPKELDKETIYRVNGLKLKDVGKIEETSAYTYTQPTYVSTPRTSYVNNAGKSKKKNNALTNQIMIQSVSEFQNRHFLSPSDMDLIFYKTLGVTCAEMGDEELELFVKEVMPKLSVNAERRSILRSSGIKIVGYQFYKDFGLVFPWMLNSQDEIAVALGKYEARVRETRNNLGHKSQEVGLPMLPAKTSSYIIDGD